MTEIKKDSQERNQLINKLILSITRADYSLNLEDYDEVVPNFVLIYHELTALHHRTITTENHTTSIKTFVQELSLNELKVWSNFI